MDYVMPQIYWTDRYVTDGKEVPMFSNRCEVWQTLHTNPEIKLYAGLALYRVGKLQIPIWTGRFARIIWQHNVRISMAWDMMDLRCSDMLI